MDYIKEFLIELEYVKNYAKNTISSYSKDLNKFQTFLKNKNLLNATSGDIRNFLKSLGEHSEKTTAHYLTSLRMFYDFLLKHNYINSSPLNNIDNPKIGKYLPDILTIEEMNRLLDIKVESAFNSRDKCILEILYSTGLRISELVDLKLENINIEDNLIKVMGKGSKERIVFLNDDATNALNNYIFDIRPQMLKKEQNDYLFLNNHGKCLTRQAVFKMIKKRAGEAKINKNISPHTLRHTFATHLLQNGTNIKYIQELLGHADLSTTEIYAHIIMESLKKDYKELNPRDN